MLTRKQVIDAYQLVLSRAPENEDVIAFHKRSADIGALLRIMLQCEEYLHPPVHDPNRVVHEPPVDQPPFTALDRLGTEYLVPTDLRSATARSYRGLLIGQCVFDEWEGVIARSFPNATIDFILVNNTVELPSASPSPIDTYDFQIVQVPLRTLLPEGAYLPLSYADIGRHEALLNSAEQRLELLLNNILGWSEQVPAFVMNYMTPQHNAMGRLLPRYDLRNPRNLIERLNEALARIVATKKNCYYLDADRVAGVFGRRFIQDDSVWQQNHGALISDFDAAHDGDRLIKVEPVSKLYRVETPGFVNMMWAEATAMFDTLRRRDAVKMVCVDLDDTLWRGVIAELGPLVGATLEGWPLGIVEALAYLKKRGVILAIISKNSEETITGLWDHLFRGRLALSDFAIRKINWSPKVESIAEAIREANVMPNSVVFLDDNPVERASVKAAFPDIRVIEAPHTYWRRILLWSSELDVPLITEESERRTEMIQAQIEREQVRTALSREDFLAGLELHVTLFEVDNTTNKDFNRTLELINKTNQFNTTGVRWVSGDCTRYFSTGGTWWAFRVTDRFTDYGLVGVLALRDGVIDQYVMSCRVLGLDVELAVLSELQNRMTAHFPLKAVLRETAANNPCRDLYARAGWQIEGDTWIGCTICVPIAHAAIDWQQDEAATE